MPLLFRGRTTLQTRIDYPEMFSIFLACTELAFNRLFLSASRSRQCIAERRFTSVDKNQYIRYELPKREEANDSTVDARRQKFDASFTVIPDVVSAEEESRFINEIEKLLKRLRYQHDHWDDVGKL